jgi:methyltransferase (TIGR00027 family)
VATNTGLIDDPFAEPLVRAAGVEYFTQLVDNQRYGDVTDDPAATALMDVLVTHTRFLDQFLADAGRAGIRQAVLLGSGLDTRPYRLWWPPGTTVYELDRPEVLDFKAEVLRGLGATLSANRCAIGIDLRQDWRAALRRVGFDDAQPTVWIAEQVLVGHLPPAVQNRLLDDVTALSPAGSRFAADHLTGPTYPGEYRSVPEYLAANGWETVDRDVVDLLAATGPGRRWRGDPDDAATRYVTATRV